MENNTVSIVNIYAPVENDYIQGKDNFYEMLQNVCCQTIPKKDEIIVVGDANTQIGREQYLRDIAGNRREILHRCSKILNNIVVSLVQMDVFL